MRIKVLQKTLSKRCVLERYFNLKTVSCRKLWRGDFVFVLVALSGYSQTTIFFSFNYFLLYNSETVSTHFICALHQSSLEQYVG